MLPLLYFCAHWLLPVRDHGVLALERKAGPHCCQSIRPSVRPSVWQLRRFLQTKGPSLVDVILTTATVSQSVSQSQRNSGPYNEIG